MVEIIISIDRELFIGKLVNKAVGKLPQLAHDPGDIDRKEAEQSSSVVLSHVIYEWLDAILWDLRHSHVF